MKTPSFIRSFALIMLLAAVVFFQFGYDATKPVAVSAAAAGFSPEFVRAVDMGFHASVGSFLWAATMPEILDLFQRRNKTLRSFLNLPDRLFTVEHDLLFNRFHMLKAMLTGGLVVPPEVDIHPSNVCTNQCRFCIGKIVATKTKAPNIMTKKEIHNVIVPK